MADGNRKWALVIGTGIALSPIHSLWLTNLTTINGQVWLFIPAIGHVIWIVGSLFFFVYRDNWQLLKSKTTWGNRMILVSLMVVVASMGISGFINGQTLGLKFAPLLMGVSLLALYLLSRVLGKDIFLPMLPLSLIVAASCIIDGIINPGEITGGFITNYCASAGYMIFGVVVNKNRYQWLSVTFVVIALFFVGALEGLFALIVIGAVVLIRRDWGWRLLPLIGTSIIVILLWISLGHFLPLWDKMNLITLREIASGEHELNEETIDEATTYRTGTIINRMSDIKPFGRGYWVTMPYNPDVVSGPHDYSEPEYEPVHNVPLVVVDQIGPVAGAAWLLITLFCFIKYRWKYAWVSILALSVFDHFIWTQLAPYWWALVGVSATTPITNDLIFKRQ